MPVVDVKVKSQFLKEGLTKISYMIHFGHGNVIEGIRGFSFRLKESSIFSIQRIAK